MNLILVLPAIADAASIALPRALERLAAYCAPTLDAGGLLHAVMAVLGAPDAAPAPLLALGAGMPLPAAGAWLVVASPVHLEIHGDDVRVAARVRGLSTGDAARAIALLNGHFAADGIRFVAARSDAWFAQLPQAPDAVAPPVDSVIGQSLYACRPQGRDARLWERYGNEIQMLLFALNDTTGASGQPQGLPQEATRNLGDPSPPNALWFWGGGTLVDGSVWRGVRAYAATADTRDGADLARGVMLASGRTAEALPDSLAALPPSPLDQKVLVVLPDTRAEVLAAHWLTPALTALETGGLSRLTVIAGAASAQIWSATPPSWLARLRARLATARGSPAQALQGAPRARPSRPPSRSAP